MTSLAGPAYVAAVLNLYVDLPDTPLRASTPDQWLARRLYERGVPFRSLSPLCCWPHCAASSGLRIFRRFPRFVHSPTFNL